MKRQKGFTLVELLVVIAIIAILAGALFIMINPVEMLKKSRDAKRVADITELNKSIAMAVADSKYTVTTTATLDSCSTANFSVGGTTGWVQFTAVGTGLGAYIAALPRDPTNVSPNCYYYRGDGTNVTWELNTALESTANASKGTDDGGNQNTCTTMPAAACKYEVGTDPGLDLI